MLSDEPILFSVSLEFLPLKAGSSRHEGEKNEPDPLKTSSTAGHTCLCNVTSIRPVLDLSANTPARVCCCQRSVLECVCVKQLSQIPPALFPHVRAPLNYIMVRTANSSSSQGPSSSSPTSVRVVLLFFLIGCRACLPVCAQPYIMNLRVNMAAASEGRWPHLPSDKYPRRHERRCLHVDEEVLMLSRSFRKSGMSLPSRRAVGCLTTQVVWRINCLLGANYYIYFGHFPCLRG